MAGLYSEEEGVGRKLRNVKALALFASTITCLFSPEYLLERDSSVPTIGHLGMTLLPSSICR